MSAEGRPAHHTCLIKLLMGRFPGHSRQCELANLAATNFTTRTVPHRAQRGRWMEHWSPRCHVRTPHQPQSNATVPPGSDLGLAPSANVNPDKNVPGFFEPVHGSAPDIHGMGIANPIAAVWAASMMLESLGEVEIAAQIMAAIEAVTAEGRVLTPDLGGKATTDQVADEIAAKLKVSVVAS